MDGISVVVCTFNRLELLKKCLQSLLDQTFADFEIIVVNDASSDGTAQFLAELTNPKIKVITHEKNLGLSPSRNDGIAKASFNLLAFTDDDCVAGKNWLAQIKQHTSAEFDFGAGQTYYVSPSYRGYFPQRVVDNPQAKWPKGNNLIFKKDVLTTIGGFDHEFDQFNNDDSEIAIRARTFGYRFKSIPTAIVMHQKTFWTSKGLLASAKNPAVWVVLKKRYPKHFSDFQPPVKASIFIHPEDYLQIITMPVFLFLLFLRFIINGQRNFKLFFTKWPWYPFLRRFYIYREAIRQAIFMF